MRLSYNMPEPTLLAKDPERGCVKRGGLGALGVGTMWQPAQEGELDADVPVESSEGQFDPAGWFQTAWGPLKRLKPLNWE